MSGIHAQRVIHLLLRLDEVAHGLLKNGGGRRLRGRDLVHRNLDQHLVIWAIRLGASVLLGHTVAAAVVENLQATMKSGDAKFLAL